MSNKVETTIDLDSISSGVRYLQQGYIDYAKEVIIGRALPNLYDGLKPVNRRILQTLKKSAKSHKNYIKSARAVGDTLSLHPHGDSSVYQAMVLMTQKNGSLAFPLVDGSGAFGGVYTTDAPAHQRYTEVRLHSNTAEYFGEMNGINMIPNFDSTEMEAEVLPVSFPAVLINSTSGIAVGFKSNIPSFNFNDVCDLVLEYLKDGECHTLICPDFVTGGYYVRDDHELKKLMTTGKAKIKLRGKTIVTGKEIHVMEVPFGKTVQGIMKQINDGNFSSIRNAYDTDDFDHDMLFTVVCSAKNKTDEALYSMYKDTDFQYSYSADITVIRDNVPKQLGVWNIIEDWVKWRRKVLIKEYQCQREDWRNRIREAEAFMNIVNDYDKRMKLVEIIASHGREEGRKFIRENFTREQVPEDLIQFVSSRALPDYHDGGKYAKDLSSGNIEINRLSGYIDNVDEQIVKQITALKAKYGSSMERRTEITDTDYQFTKDVETKKEVVDNSVCAYAFKQGFLRKLRYLPSDPESQFEFEGFANDVLLAFDNRGRILRVYCKDLPLHGITELGIFLPRYFDLNETDDYRITYICRLNGDELMLLYKDGNVGFVDTSEWLGNTRNVRVLERGIASSCADKLGAVLTTVPPILMVTDGEGRVAWVRTDDIKHKDRTAKTRVFNLVKNVPLDSFSCQTDVSLPTVLNNPIDYYNKLVNLKDPTDWRGEDSDFTMMW